MNYKAKGFLFILSIIAAIATVYYIYETMYGIMKPEETVEVAFVRQDLVKNKQIRPEDVYTRRIPVSAYNEDVMITGKELPRVYMYYTGTPVFKDELLVKKRITGSVGIEIRPDERFIYLPVSGIKQLYGQLKEGDPVDVLLKYVVSVERGDGKKEKYLVMETLFEQIKVGKVYNSDAKPIRDKTAGESGPSDELTSVVELYLKMDDLMEFIKKSELGEIILVGVPPNAPKLGNKKMVVSFSELTGEILKDSPVTADGSEIELLSDDSVTEK